MDYSKIKNIQFDGIDHKDYPDYCDAYITSAEIEENGVMRDLTDEEIDELNEDSSFVYEKLMNYLH